MKGRVDANRNFLEAALMVGLECDIISPDDVLRHLEADVLAFHLPPEERTRLLAASLKAGRMDAALVFEIIEPRVFAENMPMHMLWECIAEAATKVLREDLPVSDMPSLPVAVTPASGELPPVLGEGASRFSRRPSTSRRPARLAQSRSSVSEGSGRWSTPSREPAVASATDDHFTDWIEETVTGEATRPKR